MRKRGFVLRNVELDWVAPSWTWGFPPGQSSRAYEAACRAVAGSQRPSSLRVLGRGWGMSAVCHPMRGGPVLLSDEPDAERPRVSFTPEGRLRCLLGATFREAHEWLATHPLDGRRTCLSNQPGFSELTVIGAVGVGGHGSGLRAGPLAAQVHALELAPIPGGRASVWRVERGQPGFDVAVTHLGRLGPVLAIELDVVDRFRIAESREVLELDARATALERELEALVQRAIAVQRDDRVHSVELWIAPYVHRRALVASLGLRRYTREHVSHDARPAALRWPALLQLGERATAWAARRAPDGLRLLLQQAVRMTATRHVVMEAEQGLDFGAPNHHPMRAIEMASELTHPRDAASLVLCALGALEELAREGLHVFAPFGLRFVGDAGTAGLSPHAGWARTVHLEIPTFAGRGFDGELVLAYLQRRLATTMRARPHWGQAVFLEPGELAPLWPRARWQELDRLVVERDPCGLFESPLIDAPLRASRSQLV